LLRVIGSLIPTLRPFCRERGAAAAGSGREVTRSLVLISRFTTGGAERVTVSFLCRLARRGINVAACAVTAEESESLTAELTAAGVRRYTLQACRLADPFALLRLLRLVREQRIDLIHAHGQDASILAAVMRCLSGTRLVITRHVLDEPKETWRQKLRARLALFAARRADAVIAVSEAAADHLAAIARLPRSEIQVILNGIELERFGRGGIGVRRAQVRRALGLSPAAPVVLMPAVLRRGKGHLTLIEALPALRTRVPGVRVLFAGGGEIEPLLRSLARPHGQTIMILGPREDIPQLMAACDLVVLPSFTEALPTALIEAAAAGRPVVATRVGGNPEVVQDFRTGLLIPPDNPSALAEAVATLLNHQERAKSFGEAARRLAEERFSLDRQVEHTVALWSAVMEGAC